jgi:hypothetical protein
MAEKEFAPRAPDFHGDGVAVWKAQDKNGNLFLKVSVLGGKAVNCFKVEEKPKEKKAEF